MQNVTESIQKIVSSPRFWPRVLLTLLLINIFMFGYLLFGFQTIKISGADSASIYLNDVLISKNSTLKIRPGTYKLRAAGKDVSAKEYVITALPFLSRTIELQKSDPLTILSDAKKTPSLEGTYKVISQQYFDNDTWLVAKYEDTKNASVVVVAFRYIYGDWRAVAYSPNNLTSEELDTQMNKLPDAVRPVYLQLKGIVDED